VAATHNFTHRQRLLLALVPPLASTLIRLLGCTLRFRDVCDTGVTPGHLIPPPGVFGFWHRSLLMAAYRFRNMSIAILISQSFDGELIARTVERLGFVAIRGSSSRGGAVALLQMERAVKSGRIAAFTADGPRGPVYLAKPGLALLAQRTTGDAGAFHLHPSKAWELRSWDRFLIPKPFARVTVSWPAHVLVSPDSDLAEVQVQVQQMMDRATQMAATE
jgi:lysophospholipid acyltransferase (LPLAT)-like uncharacterized protein